MEEEGREGQSAAGSGQTAVSCAAVPFPEGCRNADLSGSKSSSTGAVFGTKQETGGLFGTVFLEGTQWAHPRVSVLQAFTNTFSIPATSVRSRAIVYLVFLLKWTHPFS